MSIGQLLTNRRCLAIDLVVWVGVSAGESFCVLSHISEGGAATGGLEGSISAKIDVRSGGGIRASQEGSSGFWRREGGLIVSRFAARVVEVARAGGETVLLGQGVLRRRSRSWGGDVSLRGEGPVGGEDGGFVVGDWGDGARGGVVVAVDGCETESECGISGGLFAGAKRSSPEQLFQGAPRNVVAERGKDCSGGVSE
mgnify:CR=1 FL=1